MWNAKLDDNIIILYRLMKAGGSFNGIKNMIELVTDLIQLNFWVDTWHLIDKISYDQIQDII